GVAGAGVNDEAGRFVDDDHVVVLVDHPELHPRVARRRLGGLDRVGVDAHDRPDAEADLARHGDLLVDGDGALGDEVGGDRPADVGEEGDDAVEPLAVEGRRELFADHPCSSSVAGSRSEVNSSSAPPTVTPMSATLKIGNHCRSMKSTTAPWRRPSPRKSRSATLPSAPPVTSPTAMVYHGLEARPSEMSSTAMTTMARIGTNGPNPSPDENAMPVL